MNNKYERWYHSIVSRAKLRIKPNCYFEKHHIIPRCIGVKESEETRLRKSIASTGNPKPWLKTPEHRKNVSIARKGKGLGGRNSMADPLNRNKVGESKMGRRKYLNPLTGNKHYIHPNQAPESYILVGK